MQNQLQWRQHSFDHPKRPDSRINAPNGTVATSSSPSAGLNASGIGSSAGNPNSRSFASTAAPTPKSAQPKSGPTVVRLEHPNGDGSSTGSNANTIVPNEPNKENAANPGPRPVLKMKRTGQHLPLSSQLYQRTKSPSVGQSSGSSLSSNPNKKLPVAPSNRTAFNATADRQPESQAESQAVGHAISTDIPKPIVGDVKVKKAPRPGGSKSIPPIPLEPRSAGSLVSSSDSGEDSDGAIKYEKGHVVGFDDAVEGDASDRETSDGESGSESDGDETVENSETQNPSFQQLFQPPDLDPGSDNEADYTSDDENEDEDEDDASTSVPSSSDSESEDIPPVTIPTASAPRQVAFPTTVLTKANSNRLYTQLIDRGQIIKASPAIFPDGYERCAEFKALGQTWICPIRSCRLCYKNPPGLSNHARFAHKRTLLNDNMDGTLSIVGTYTQKDSRGCNPPLVVSKRPLDPNEPPIAKPALPGKGVHTKIKALTQNTGDSTRVLPKRKRIRRARRETESHHTLRTPKIALNSSAAAAGPDGRSKLVSSSQIKPLEMATKDRTYKLIENINGDLIPTCGALLPRHYKNDSTFSGHPWICPVRNCRCVFSKLVALGSHFVRQHWARLLNDNLDGTLSEVGTYETPLPGKTSLPAVVISQKPLDPSAGPIAEPKFPAQHKGDKGKEISSRPHEPSAVVSSQPSSAAEKISQEQASKFWDYLLPFLPDNFGPMPDGPELLRLLGLPRKRTVAWRDAQIKRRLDADHVQLLALVIHLVGDLRKPLAAGSRERTCTNCVNGLGPFKGCQTVSATLFPAALDCCANCLFERMEDVCSARASSLPPKDELFPDDVTREAAGSQGKRRLSDAEADDDGFAAAPRRSGRLQSSDDTANVEPKRKMVKLSINSGQNKMGSRMGENFGTTSVSSGSGARQAVDASSSIVLHAGQIEANHFEMEDWEIAPGHIREAGVEWANNIAFSKPYLEQRQDVQISTDVHFRVETIKSGHTSEIEYHAKNTRYCSIASGKLWVTIDGQEQFIIGTHGMFKIMPGRKVRMQNRLYIDSVLHISTYASW